MSWNLQGWVPFMTAWACLAALLYVLCDQFNSNTGNDECGGVTSKKFPCPCYFKTVFPHGLYGVLQVVTLIFAAVASWEVWKDLFASRCSG